jgi:RPA family protein
MDGAVRLFAGEFSSSTLTVPDRDDRNAAWVVTPSGGFCRQVFIAGALVEVHELEGFLTFRVADPTGGFDCICGGNTTSLAESVRAIPLPSFVSVAGRAQMYRRDGKSVLTIRPEHVQVIDRRTRDQWVITTARATIRRLEAMLAVLKGTSPDDRIRKAVSHYSPTPELLDGLAGLVEDALASVRPAEESAAVAVADPRDTIMEFLRAKSGPRGTSVEEVLGMARANGISQEAALAAIESLIVDDECYQPQKGFVKLL